MWEEHLALSDVASPRQKALIELAVCDVSRTHFCLHCASVTQTHAPSSVRLPAHAAQLVSAEHFVAAHASPSRDEATAHTRASRTFISLAGGFSRGKKEAVTLKEDKTK